jgi:starch synthase (maltosyl-transferring)
VSTVPTKRRPAPAEPPRRLPNVPEGRRRVVIEGVSPEIDGGRFPVKRVIGETVAVEADVFADGHDQLAPVLRYRRDDDPLWSEVPMEPIGNDRWRGAFTVESLGRYRYTLRAWIERFGGWRRDTAVKIEAGQDVTVELLAGAEMVERAAGRATGTDRRVLREFAGDLRSGGPVGEKAALSVELAERMEQHPDRRFSTSYGKELEVVVDRERARFGAWYEAFPRSTSPDPTRPGTLRDTVGWLPYIAGMGFDVLYLPPIHPIGRTHRKGRNNDPVGRPGDPGSPWAIGAEEGGHTAIHPDLGTFEDFDALVAAARDHGLEIALDVAYQCAPDHPWVREHPEWFRRRPDGSIQYAENPPKKYQDIYPLDFETEAWRELWAELRAVMEFWIARGVRIFRVDNPHTKALRFWEWVIGELKAEHPELIFLAEAFTRPRLMYGLAKLGFTQSYTYFAWRSTKQELTDYLTELTQTEVREYFRPNLWPNTPDILTAELQAGARSTFMARLVLAATLGASYGIYGPAYELMEHRPIAPGKEEYRNSEKYEVRHWNLGNPRSLAPFVAAVNRIRHDHPGLHGNQNLVFHPTTNDSLIAYSKATADWSDVVLTVVNLDPRHRQSGFVHLWLDDLGAPRDEPFAVEDLLTGARFVWRGSANYVELDPSILPAHILRVGSGESLGTA